MNRAALESADRETLILLVLTQAEAITSLTRQVEILTKRVAELEAKLGLRNCSAPYGAASGRGFAARVRVIASSGATALRRAVSMTLRISA